MQRAKNVQYGRTPDGSRLPDVPIRQWVLSVPFELRLLFARNAAALSAVGRIFVREIWRWQREQFGASLVHARNAEASRTPNIRGGAVCFPQRFGGSLNLNVHYHVAVPDGVFSREHQGAQGVVFHQLPIPNRSDLEVIGHAVELRVLNWLRRRGLLDADDAEQPRRDAERQRDALDACLRGSLGIGELSRLLRYCARPPLSLERLSVLADGRVAYRIKTPRGRQTHRVMSPTQFLARLCALIPPPRHPLVRFHGVFAPHSSWRRHVVALANGHLAADRDAMARACGNGAVRDHDPNSGAPLASARPVESTAPTALGARGQAAIFRPAEIAVAHDTRIDWATLLKRVHAIDALACACGGRLRVIALITDLEVVAAILTSLHLPAAPPTISKARSPDYYDPAPD